MALFSRSCAFLFAASRGADAVHDMQKVAALIKNDMASEFPAGSIDVSPSDLLAYISTGQLPAVPTVVNAHESVTDQQAAEEAAQEARDALASQRADQVIARLHSYEDRLREARTHAQDAYDAVLERERQLAAAFEPELQRLRLLVEEASDRAAQAEARAMVERLQRTHFEQAAALDRSARFWEERILRERELTRQAESHASLDASAVAQNANATDALEASAWAMRDTEKTHMENWLAEFQDHLQSEEALVQISDTEGLA